MTETAVYLHKSRQLHVFGCISASLADKTGHIVYKSINRRVALQLHSLKLLFLYIFPQYPSSFCYKTFLCLRNIDVVLHTSVSLELFLGIQLSSTVNSVEVKFNATCFITI